LNASLCIVLCQIRPMSRTLALHLIWAYAKEVKFAADVQALRLQCWKSECGVSC
uniref:Uncharacterized protein n=1 Tax=Oryctolagus cuniculus TaxID=9986 RepID=A0A5F9CQS1_RABIT